MKRILIVLMLTAFLAAPAVSTVDVPNEAPVLYDPGDGPRADDPGDGPIICPCLWSALFDASLIVFDLPVFGASIDLKLAMAHRSGLYE